MPISIFVRAADEPGLAPNSKQGGAASAPAAAATAHDALGDLLRPKGQARASTPPANGGGAPPDASDQGAAANPPSPPSSKASGGAGSKLTFDGERVVLGRGSGCDVRLPDPSVTLRHASIRAKFAEYTLVDEGSSNGTYVNGVRLTPHLPNPLRNGDVVRLGRVVIDVRIEHAPATSDLAVATRDMAIAMVSQAMRRLGRDASPRIVVVEGRDAGASLTLTEDDRDYVVGRGDACDLMLLDPDVSREHVRFVRRSGGVFVRELGSKNGALLGETRLPEGRDVTVRSGARVALGKTVLSLEDPAVDALLAVEQLDDEVLAAGDGPVGRPPERGVSLTDDTRAPRDAERRSDGRSSDAPSNHGAAVTERLPTATAPVAAAPRSPVPPKTAARRRGAWRVADLAIMVAALVVLALSLAGLVWLLRS